MTSQKEFWDEEYKNNSDKWKKETLFLPSLLHNKRVLELGCGNGKTITSILRQKPSEVTAIDFSSEAINLAKKNFNGKFINFIQADVKDLPFRHKEFDVVICFYILNNLLAEERVST